MQFLYEEGGEVKAATLLGEASSNADSWQVETPFGKRIKLRAKDVWMKFTDPAAGALIEQATALVPDIDMDLLWECSPEGEFQFEAAAKEYFGDGVKTTQLAALAMALQGAPIYFRRKGKGNFQKAPEEQLKAALASVERKKSEALLQAQWEAELIEGKLPEVLVPMAQQLLFAPDKNGMHYKALNSASQRLGISTAALLIKVGAINSPLAVHQGNFLREHFARGIHFPAGATIDPATWQKIANDLPKAQVQAFSIDDQTTTEIDDAFSVTQLPNGHYQVGVHIAAPGLAIARDDVLDEVARKRLSTAYFPGGKITMLPESVINIFSLESSRDEQSHEEWIARPALSLYVTVDDRGELVLNEDNSVSTRVERVPMAANLRLHEIEHLVTNESLADVANTKLIPFQHELGVLWKCAQTFHAKRQATRVENGQREEKLGPVDPTALARDFNFEIFDENNQPVHAILSDNQHIQDKDWTVSIQARQRGSVIDTIVAEWMIFCNSTWGGLLAKQDIPAVYRAQQGWGAQRTRMQTSPCRHEGLGVENYAWCTSPLRRYADLVNQWQLIALAKNGVMAKLAAPFQAKDTQLMAIAADFDATYSAYGDHQGVLEKHWCLRWIKQQNLPWRGLARTLKDGQIRLENIPLRLTVPELAEQPRGITVEIEILDVDLLELTASVRVIQIKDQLKLENMSEVTSELSSVEEPETTQSDQVSGEEDASA